jgi:hypothetical protein
MICLAREPGTPIASFFVTMRKTRKNGGLLTSAVMTWAVAGAAAQLWQHDALADHAINAFAVAKEINSNFVNYDARLTDDCRFDENDPLDIYWMSPEKDGSFRRDGLNFIEKMLYGVNISHQDPHVLVGEVKAVEKKGLKLPFRIVATRQGNGCSVRTYVSGHPLPHEITLSSLFLKKFSGSSPKQMAINGTDNQTRKYTSYTVDLG